MKTTFIPVDYNTFDFEGKNYVRIIGRDDKNKRVCIIDKFEPYIWAILRDNIKENKIKKLEEKIQKIEIESNLRITKVQKTEVHNKKFLGKDVKAIKIFITNYKDAHPVADRLDFPEIQARREYDIPLITKYIIDKKISPFSWYRITGETTNIAGVGNFAETCIFADKIEKIEKSEENKFNPKILAYDIEADEFEIGKGEILMISIASEKTKKVLTWKKSPEKASSIDEAFQIMQSRMRLPISEFRFRSELLKNYRKQARLSSWL